MTKTIVLNLAIFLAAAAALSAQVDTSANSADSLKVYQLGEVVASSAKNRGVTVQPATINRVSYKAIQNTDAGSVAGLAAVIPAGRIQTNSRGESLLFLRGAGERQLALFLDGALLNIPWDNRIDLSLIPADIIGQISVSKGASSILYGANILGGAVNISTIERRGEGMGGLVRVGAGEANAKRVALLNDATFGDLNYIAFFGYDENDGFLLPGDLVGQLGNQNPNSSRRSNTDSRRLTAYLRTEYQLSEHSALGLSFNHINAEKGIAPEAHRSRGIRFWRYPDWKRSMFTLNGRHAFDAREDIELRGALWLDFFSQTIDDYRSIAYDTLNGSEINDDLTGGGRLALSMQLDDEQSLSVALSGYSSTHDEEITEFDGDGATSSMAEYQQNIYSLGAEYKIALGLWTLTAGATLDGSATPKTGVFPAQDGQMDFGALAGVRYFLSESNSIFANLSRRTRFPTLREQFSGALGKFVPNPDLQAESGILAELGGEYREEDIALQAAAFYNRYQDGIVKEKLDDGLEQRINLDETLIYGAEFAVEFSPVDIVDLSANVTWLYARGKEDGSFDRKLEYKPEILAALNLEFAAPAGLEPSLELEYTGSQYGDNGETGSVDELDAYTLVHARLARTMAVSQAVFAKAFIRVNNVFDQESFTQLGLPQAGRMLWGGIEILY